MFRSACDLMKKSTLTSATLVIGGALLSLLAPTLPTKSALPMLVSYLGLFAVVFGSLLMVAIAIAILLPKVSRDMNLCRH